MRIKLACITCALEADVASVSWAELTESGIYRFACPKGHESWICLQEQKFEVLYDLGVSALLDGYYREAVSAFAGSLERFHEFFVQAVMLERGIDGAAIDATWKLVSSQSERQFGAFVAASLIVQGIPPKALLPKSAEFRNAVIHKGVFPPRERAEQFGEEVLGLISVDLAYLKEHAPKGVAGAVHAYVAKVRAGLPAGVNPVSMGYPTTISIARSPAPSATLQEAMQFVAKSRARWLEAPGA